MPLRARNRPRRAENPTSGGPRKRGRNHVRLRTYRAVDHAAVVRLWRGAGLHISPSDRRPELARALRRDPELFVVAESDGRIVGAVLGRFDGRRGWINHLAVDAAHRRRGLGARLMLEVERRLRAVGCPKVNLHVLATNRGVVAFYESIGYRLTDMLFLERWLRRGRLPRRPTARRRGAGAARPRRS